MIFSFVFPLYDLVLISPLLSISFFLDLIFYHSPSFVSPQTRSMDNRYRQSVLV